MWLALLGTGAQSRLACQPGRWGVRAGLRFPAPSWTLGLVATMSKALFLEALSPSPGAGRSPALGWGHRSVGPPQTLGGCGRPGGRA